MTKLNFIIEKLDVVNYFKLLINSIFIFHIQKHRVVHF